MFKTISLFGRLSNKSSRSLQQALHDFSIAEFSSAIEMLHAAKRRDAESESTAMTAGFIRHALDEYKHTEMFRAIIKLLASSNVSNTFDTRFIPLMTVTNGYINPGNFLYDRFALDRFSIFIGVNEGSAHHLFTKLQKRFLQTESTHLSEEHLDTINSTFDSILRDEKRHAEYALRYSRENVPKWRFRYLMTHEKIATKIRSLYASQAKVNFFIAKFIYMFIITMMYPLRRSIYLPKKQDVNLLKRENKHSML